MRTNSSRAALLVLAGVPLLLGGCIVAALAVGAAATYGAVKYTENEAYRDFHSNLDTVWAATLRSMHDLGYPISEGVPHGATEGYVEIDDVRVRVTREPGDFTRVHVRVGTFDNDDHRRRAALLLD